MVESVRQWFILLSTIVLVTLCGIAVRRIYMTQTQFTQDSLLILLEGIKVLLYFIYEFFKSHLYILLAVVLIQSFLRAVVCSNFLLKALIITNSTEEKRRFFKYLYYSLLGLFYVAMIVLASVSETRIVCVDEMFSKFR